MFDGDDVAIRISGRPTAAEDDEEEDEDEDAEDSAEGEDEEAEVKSKTARKPLAALLRIARPRKSPPEEILNELEAGDAAEADDYELPSIELLLPGETYRFEEQEKEVRRQGEDFGKDVPRFRLSIFAWWRSRPAR